MNPEQLKIVINKLAIGQWSLRQLTCPHSFEKEAGIICYSTVEDAETFAVRIGKVDRKLLRPVTGWRDDYGVMGGAFQYRQQPYEVGISFVRSDNFTSEPEFNELKRLKAQGYVTIFVTTDKPRDR